MTLEFGQGPLVGVDLASPVQHAERDFTDVWRLLRDEAPVLWHPAGVGEQRSATCYSFPSRIADRCSPTTVRASLPIRRTRPNTTPASPATRF